MSDATEAIVDIQEALSEYGSSITVNSITKGTYSTSTGLTNDTTSSTTTKCIVSSYDSMELANENIHANDLKFVLYYSGAINYTDTITFNSKTYKILNVDKKIFQDVNILYTIQGRA